MDPRTFLVLVLLGFASGLPLFLTGSTLKAWMTDAGLNLKVIGAFSFVTLPYSLKVLWAPLVDRFGLPFLGRRRSWMMAMQAAMGLILMLLALQDPALRLRGVLLLAVGVALTSATFDIAVDAWRVEVLPRHLLGLGTSIHITAYRVAMLVSGGGALILAQKAGWRATYLAMAGLTGLGMLGTFLARDTDSVASAPRSLQAAVVEPLRDLLPRPGMAELMSFAVLFKLGDWLAESMTMPFLIRGVGFTKFQIGSVQKTTAMLAIILGGLAGGALLAKVSLRRALWVFGFLQAGSILGFWAVSRLGANLPVFVAANALENFAYGAGASGFAVLVGASCNRAYTATQYALFTSLMALPRTVFAGATGWLAEGLQTRLGVQAGWSAYFLCCVAAAIPGLLLLLRYRHWGPPEDPSGA
ncbi:MAG TPA: MFS transporter [Holophagaceae bacterium]|nr:MFS transporter [Holophagaceae bacterium]